MPATWLLMEQLGGSNEQAGCGIPGLTERPRSPDLTTLLSLPRTAAEVLEQRC